MLTPLLVGAGALGAYAAWHAYRRTLRVACTLELESTPEQFHAHAVLQDDLRVQPGDEVQIHDAPDRIPLGARQSIATHATVRQASPPRRFWTRLTGGTSFQDLYDVGFEG